MEQQIFCRFYNLADSVNKRKLFKSNKFFGFEQDFAKLHSTNKKHDFVEKNPFHIPTLYLEKENLYFFPPKMDDVWSIEIVCGILAQNLYAHLMPTHVNKLLKRLKKVHKSLKTRKFNQTHAFYFVLIT